MTREPEGHTADWWGGWRLGLEHRATGEVACICGGERAAEMAAGYAAARYGGRDAAKEARDGSDECDGGQLCETHTSRAARAEQYQQALEQEMEADA